MASFDESYDVVVVGYGFAGAVAAINAADAGARVLLAEKEPAPGGISICSYGAIRCAHSASAAFAYLQATNAGRTPDDVLRTLAEGMTTLEADVRELAGAAGAEILTRENGGNYPFPGYETFYDTNVVRIPGYDEPQSLYPNLIGSNSQNGWRVFKMLQDNIAARDITVLCGLPARRLIADEHRAVQGVSFAGLDGATLKVAARRGVVLACGGFEAAEDLKQQYWEKTPVLSAATTSNTGDGIRMAQDLGAQLWHMWHFHGSYGFRHPDPRFSNMAIRAKRLPDWLAGRDDTMHVQMAWIVVDRDGRRYMNECTPYTQDTSHRPMELYDTERQLFPRIPSHLIFDENGRKLYPIGAPTFNNADLAFDWSHDNLREVELGILKKADTPAELARAIGCDPAAMEATLAHWNDLCRAGRDADFGRPPGSMMPLDTPPYYTGPIWPVVSNTQGGPVHDPRQRVLDVFGAPIERLYVAGELGSVFGHLYLSGGNLTECFAGGRIAGREAAAQAPRN
ncbi:MAG TPA: FAD-binding protein [Candidatus Lustribacter sp.]|nr:FAD-binding protein [Candidatus Lustribacter sp.]